MIAIGVDIGGTKTAITAVRDGARVLATVQFPTEPARGFRDAVDRIADGIERVSVEAGIPTSDLRGIGIGCTGPVDPHEGTIHNPYTLPGWDGGNIVAELQQRFGVPVRLECDGDAAMIGEWREGAAKGLESAAMLTFGTGIGFGAIVNGQLLRGARRSHPEPGHLPVRSDGPQCYCGVRGCLESLASGTAIDRIGRLHGFDGSRQVFSAARAGDIAASLIIRDAVDATAITVWSIAHLLAPEVVILGGGMMDEHFDLFEPSIRAQLALGRMVPSTAIRICRASLGPAAGAIGAAGLVD